LKTKADPTGRSGLGTLNNCAGGQTPWGTYLTGEENCNGYFWTDQKASDGKRLTKGIGGAQQKSYERYGIPSNWYSWGRFHERFNVDKEANECNRFHWIVEIDPMDPASTPVKHTALGRFRHEGAEMIVNKDGRVVVYSGDDAQFDYVYRFVSKDTYRPGDKAHNMRLLSEGTLSVARLNEDGSVVQAVAAHAMLLDQHDADAQLRGRCRHRQAARSGADHAQVRPQLLGRRASRSRRQAVTLAGAAAH
jgi:uncharacterized protein